MLTPTLGTVLLSSTPASAAIPPISQRFYTPLREAQMVETFETITSGGASSSVRTVVSITATQDGSVISYDHWEDGFESDETNPTQGTTEIWGDGIASNGCVGAFKTPPVNPCTDADDAIYEGDVLFVESDIPAAPRNFSQIFFDGGDKVLSSAFIVVSQAQRPVDIGATSGSLLGGAVEVYDLRRWGTEFRVPVGEDLTAAQYNGLFDYVSLTIMASEDNTTVDLDFDADGFVDETRVLQEGAAIHVDGDVATAALSYPSVTNYNIGRQVNAGTIVTASADIQAYIASANLTQRYQARFFELVPTGQWTNEYYAPVPSQPNDGVPPGEATDASLLLQNPSASDITITLTYADGSQTPVAVPANSTEIFVLPRAQSDSGVRLTSPDDFFAVSVIDSTGQTATSDWGYTLLPASGLTRSLKAGWAPGSDDPAAENSNPIWFMVSDDTRVYVDYNGDGQGPLTDPNGVSYDVHFDLTALQRATVLDPDNDQTGTFIYTLDNVVLAGAYGQDGTQASPASPALDLGTTVFPGPAVSIKKSVALVNDLNGNGLLDVGESAKYTVVVTNDSTVSATDVVVIDLADGNSFYVPGSTVIDGVPLADDDAPATPFPLDEAGLSDSVLFPGDSFTIEYEMLVDPDTDPLTSEIINTVTMTSSAGGGISSTLTTLKFPSLSIVKSNNDADGIVDPGQEVEFTVEVTNTDSLTQNSLTISDLIPTGLTYVPESTVAVGTSGNLVNHQVRDEFQAVSYLNNDGPDSWSAAWNENGETDNPSADRIQIVLNRLRMQELDGRSIVRGADLSDPSVTQAVLTLDYDVSEIGNEAVNVELWNGGAWDTIAVLDEFLASPFGTVNHILTPAQISANTQVQFITGSGGWATDEIAYVDNVDISWDTGATSVVTLDNISGGATPDLAEGDPTVGNLVIPVDGYSLATSDKLTITYRATVDIDAVLDLTNTATVTSAESPDPASEESTVTVDQPMNLDVLKTATLNGTGIAGDTLDYAISVTNTSNVPVYGIDMTDSLTDANLNMTCAPIEPFDLAAGASASCNATHTITQTDVDNGLVDNTATATGTDHNGDPVTDDSDDPTDPTDVDPDGDGNPDDPTTTPLLQTTSLNVTKTDTLNGTGVAGDTVDYDITVTNDGTVTMSNVDVADTLSDANVSLLCTPVTPATLAPGASIDCTATHTVSQAEVDLGQVSNTAIASGTDPSGANFTDVSDDPDDPTDSDPNGDGNPDDPTLTPLQQAAVLEVVQDDVLVGTGVVGDTINYTITVTNDGTVTIDGIDVTNTLGDVDGSIVCVPVEDFALAPGASATCTGTHTVTQADVDAGSVTSQATAAGDDPANNPVSDLSDDPTDLTDVDTNGNGNPDDPNVTPLTQTAVLEVIQDDVLVGTGVAGDTINYTITVTNDGTVTINGIDVTNTLGDVDGSITCTPVENFNLAPGASATCTGTHTVTQADVDSGSVTSQATATGTDPAANPVSDLSDDPTDATNTDTNGNGNPDDPNITPLTPMPSLNVTKTDLVNGTGIAGDTIDYTITVTNNGTVTVTGIDLVDSLTDANLNLVCTPIEPFNLAPGTSADCVATHTISQADVDNGSVSNSVTATGSDPGGNPVTDDSDDPDDPTDVDPNGDGEPDDPTVTPLLVQASLDVTNTDTLNGSGAVGDAIDYAIVVTNDGTITVDGITVTDSLTDADASLTCLPVEPFTLAPGASATCTATHTVTQSDIDNGLVSTQTTAAGTDPSSNPVVDESDDPDDPTDVDPNGDGNPDDPTVTPLTPTPVLQTLKTDTLNGTGAVGDTIDYDITVTNIGNATVTDVSVSDSLADADASLDCSPTVIPVTMAPLDSFSCTATHTITQSDVDAGQVTNVATASGLDPSGNPVTDPSDDPDNPTDTDPDGDGNPDDPTVTPLSPSPELQVTKSDSLNGTGVAGDTIDYGITITNSGNVTISSVSVADSLADADASLTCVPVEPFTIAPGTSVSCTATHTITQVDVDAGQVVNTVAVAGTDPSGTPVNDQSDDPDDPTDNDPDGDGEPDDPTITPLTKTGALDVQKTDTVNGAGAAGDTIDYAITVENIGTVTLTSVTVTDSLADADASLSCTPATPLDLAPGETTSCTATHTITQAEVDAGLVENTATATGTDPDTNPVTDDSDDPTDPTDVDPDGDGNPDDPTTTPLAQTAELNVTKVDTLNGTGIAGDTIDYAIVVTNTGTVTVADIDVTDSLADAEASLTCTPAEVFTLLPGESATCTSTTGVSQPDVDAGFVSSFVTASGTDPSANPVSDISDDPADATNIDPNGDGNPDDPTVTPLTPTPAIDIVKIDTLNGTGVAGDTITYSITTTNSGTVSLTNVDVSDSLADADASLNCAPTSLPATLSPGQSFSCTATHTITQSEVDTGFVTNTATATATGPTGVISDLSDDPDDPADADTNGNGDPDDPTVTPLLQLADLQVTKTDVLAGTGIAGDVITYSITVVNAGTVTTTVDEVLDPVADTGTLDCAPTVFSTTLLPGESFTCTATHVVTQADVDAGQVSNVATANGTDPAANPVTDDSDDPDDPTDVDPDTDGEPDDPTVTPLAQAAELQVTKTDSLNGTGVAGDTVDYTIVVVNSGTVSVNGISITDSLPDVDASITCSPAEAFALVPGASATCTGTHTITQTEVDAGFVTNTATASGTDPGGSPVTDNSDDPDDPTNTDPDGDGEPDDPTVTALNGSASLSVTETDVLGGTGIAGDIVTYSITVENTGAVTVDSITMANTLADAEGSTTCTPAEPFTLAPGATATCTATHTVTQAEVDAGQVISTATATGTDPVANPVTDDSDDPDDPTDVDANGDLDPDDPTVTPLTQTPEIQVTKTHSLNGAGIAGDTIDYTIDVFNTGTVTVSNITVADSVSDADASLTCLPVEPFTLAPGAIATCTATHTVTQAEVDAGQFTNTASASGTDPDGNPVTDDSDDPTDPTDVDPDGDGEPDDPTVTLFTPTAELQVTATDVLTGPGDAGDTVTYTLTVENTGTVTVSGTTLTASLADADATISCVPPEAFTLAPGATASCTAAHTVTQTEADAGQVVLTATATGSDPAAQPVVDLSDDPDDATNVDTEADGEPDDPTVTPLTQTPELQVIKTGIIVGAGNAGDTIDYTISVTNTGNVTVTDIDVTDSLADAEASLSCTPAENFDLAVGDTATCTATHTITQAEVDAGLVENTATASGVDPNDRPVTDDSDDPNNPTDVDPDGDGNPDDPTTNLLTQTPELSVTKVDALNGTGAAGDTIDYVIDITNTGNVTVTDIDVTDSLADAEASLSCTPAENFDLAVGDTATCTATHTITQAEVDAGLVENTATASGVDPNDRPVTDDSDDPSNPTDTDPDGDGNPDDPTNTTLTPVAELQVSKTGTLVGAGLIGDTIDYTIDVFNTGTVSLTIDTVTDPTADGGLVDCSPTSLPTTITPGASFTCTAAHTIVQADVDAGEVVNTATATGTDPGGNPVTDDSDDPTDPTNDDPDTDGEPDDPTVVSLAQIPELEVIKTGLVVGSGNAGDTVSYTIGVTNIGNVTITGIDVSDTLADADAVLSCTPTEAFDLIPGASATCATLHTITQAEVDAGVVENTATATGTDPGGNPVTDDSDDPTDPTDVDPDGDGNPDDPTRLPLTQTPELSVTKVDSVNGTGIAGDTIDYTIVTTNTGNVTVTGVTMSDSLADADASLDCLPAVTPVDMAPGDSFTCTAIHTITQTEVDAGIVENTATATGTDPNTRPVTDDSDDPSDPTNVDPDGDGNPDDPTTSTLNSTASLEVTKTDVLGGTGIAGDTVNYSIVVTNTGVVTVDGITLTDTLADADATLTCSPTEAFSLAPGATAACTAAHTVTQPEVDAGFISASVTATGTDPGGSAVVDLSDDPNDATNADTEGDGEPDDPTVTPLTQVGTIELLKAATFDGNVAVGNTVDYTLTAINTGTVALTNVSITDALADADASMSCTPLEPFGLAPGASASCTASHTITQAEIDAGRVVNTATVEGTDPSGTPVTDDSDDPNDPTNDDPDGDGNPDDPTVTPLLGDARLEVTKVDILAGTGVPGDTITYTITASNVGVVSLSNVFLTDSLEDADRSLDCGLALPTTLAPGASITCTAVHTLTQDDVDAASVVNTVTASAEDPSGTPVTDESDDPDDPTDDDPDGDGEPDDPTVTLLTSSNNIQLIKTASTPSTAGIGDPIGYTFVIVNAGLSTLTDVTLIDPMLDAGSTTCGATVLPTTLAPGESVTCTAVHSINAADLAAEEVINSAVAEGLSPVGDPVRDTSDDPVEVTNVDDNADGEPDDPTIVTLIPPVAPDNMVVINTPASPGSPVVIDVVGDDSDADGSIDPTSVNLIGGTDIDGDGNTDELVIPGEGTWTVDRVTGDITFVPEPGFTNNPTPILYTVADDQGIVSQPAEVGIDFPPVAIDDSSMDNPFGTRVVVNVVNNDDGGDEVIPATLSLVGGVDTDGDGYADELVVAGEGVWRVNNVAGRVSFKPEDGFVGDPTPVDYLIQDVDGRPTQAAVLVTYQAQPTTSIEGTVFNDKNANNIQDGDEPDISGVTVTLSCAGPDGVMGTADDVVSSTVTASPYRFDGITIGDTCVVEMGNGLGSYPIQTADPDNNRDGKTTITVAGEITNLNFGYRAAPMLSVTGTNSQPLALIALLMILIGVAMVTLPERINDWREPEYW